MIDISGMTVRGQARVACSLFPVDLSVTGERNIKYRAVRFMLVLVPEGGWVAAAWRNNGHREPIQVVSERVSDITEYTPKAIIVTTDEGNLLTVSGSGSCGCGGSVLRTFNPFGSATIALVKAPRTGEGNG